MARSVMDQIIAYGGVRRGLLGVSIATLTPDIAESYDLDDTSGALVTVVGSGSAAETAGLQIGDVIVSVNGEPIENPSGLRNSIGLMRPGDEVSVGYIREGREVSVTTTLGELVVPGGEPEQLAEVDPVFEGAEFETNNASRPSFNGVAGVLATAVEPGSTAYLRGLRTADVIPQVNRERVLSVDAMREIIDNAGSVLLQVSRENRGVLLPMR